MLTVTAYTALELVEQVPDAQTVNAKYFDTEERALQVAGDQLVYINPVTAGIFAERLPPLTLGGVKASLLRRLLRLVLEVFLFGTAIVFSLRIINYF